MLSVYHGLTSAVLLLIYAFINGFTITQTASWVLVGVLSSILMDLDHIVLCFVFNTRKTLREFSRPLNFLKHPTEFFRRISYGNIKFHRTFTHIFQILVVFFLLDLHPLVTPAFIGMVIHLATAMIGDRLTKKF